MEEDTWQKLRDQLEKLGGAPRQWGLSDDEEKLPEPVLWKEIDGMSFPNDRWLVKDIFPKEGVSIVASISGEGKSLVIMHLAKCLSEGSPWFGDPRFATQKTKVLYVNLEMSVSEMQRRGRMMGYDPADSSLFILNEDDFNLNDSDNKDTKYLWLLGYILKSEIKVLIIDTFRPATGGMKEEKAEEVRKFFQKFQVLKNSGVSVIFTEHLRKPAQFEGKIPKKEQLFGSQDKVASVETLLMLKKDEVTHETCFYQRKNRLGPEIKPFAVKITDALENERTVFKFNYIGEIEDETKKKDSAKALILDILSGGDMRTTKELLEITKKEAGPRNTRQALREMQLMGEINSVKVGKQNSYFIPKEPTESTLEMVSPAEENSFFDEIK